jgi:hypothetical protein
MHNPILKMLDIIETDLKIQKGGNNSYKDESLGAMFLYTFVSDSFHNSNTINITELSYTSLLIECDNIKLSDLGSHNYFKYSKVTKSNNGLSSITITDFYDIKNFRKYVDLNKHRFGVKKSSVKFSYKNI